MATSEQAQSDALSRRCEELEARHLPHLEQQLSEARSQTQSLQVQCRCSFSI